MKFMDAQECGAKGRGRSDADRRPAGVGGIGISSGSPQQDRDCAQAGIDMSHKMFPDFVGMLPSSATGPQECLLIMAFEFRSQVYEGMALIPSYTEYLLTCDMEPALQQRRGGRKQQIRASDGSGKQQ